MISERVVWRGKSLDHFLLEQECSSVIGVLLQGIFRPYELLDEQFAITQEWICFDILDDQIAVGCNACAKLFPVEFLLGQVSNILEVLFSPFVDGEDPRNHWSNIHFF